MNLPTPIHLGGTFDVTAVSVGRDPDAVTVWDCPVCGGHAFADDWHLRATVRDRTDRDCEEYVYCDPECLRAWLRLFPDT